MPDSSFEIAFSDLAHASVAEKAPGLMEYLIGFQLLDKNDEETHAIGVFGFKVGNQWFYAPVFFLNGALKGLDLLYVKGQDMFVPMQDNWVNYLVSKQPRKLGQTEQQPESELRITQPDFRLFSESPGTSGSKWASVIDLRGLQPWARGFMPGYRQIFTAYQTKVASAAEAMDLRTQLQRHPELAAPLAASMRANLKFAEAVLQHYELKDLLPAPTKVAQALARPIVKKAEHVGNYHQAKNCPHYVGVDAVLASLSWRGKTKQAAAEAEDAHKVKNQDGDADQAQTAADDVVRKIEKGKESPAVTVITSENAPNVIAHGEILTDKEKEQLQKGEMVIRDHRDQTSKVYDAEFDRHLSNPTETGVYELLSSVGEFKKCLVIHNPKTVGNGRTAGVCTVVALDDGRQYGSYRDVDLFCYQSEAGHNSFNSDLKDVFKKAKALSSMKSGYVYVLIDESGNGTIPFKFLTSVAKNDGTVQYAVSPEIDVRQVSRGPRSTLDRRYGWNAPAGIIMADDSDCTIPCCTGPRDDESNTKGYDKWELEHAKVLVVTEKASVTRLHHVGNSTVVPTDRYRAIEIGRAKYAFFGDGEKITDRVVSFDPGTLADAEMYVVKLGAYEMIVHADGPEVVIRHERGNHRLRKTAAVEHLVRDWGIKGDEAQQIVKQARREMKQYFVKLSDTLQGGPTAPMPPSYATSFNPLLGAAITEQQTDFMPVNGMQPQNENRFAYKLMDDPTMQQAVTAGKSGQKDVFDTAVMSGLVKTVDTDAMVDSFLPDMIKGMDRIGRTLFVYYWHSESFRDRYGRQDLIELEDSLRNVFKSMGDLVLFLKQKTVDADPMTDAVDVSLKDMSL
jgi:hypothetical protein